VYDRQFLLGPKRNVVLDLHEVVEYGLDSYGDADYVSVYGMRPADWYASGARLMGRTAVECTRDVLADAIGKDVAAIASARLPTSVVLVDPFVGSGNTLFWRLRHLPRSRAVGFELDPGVFRLTQRNLAALALPIDILNVDYPSGFAGLSVTPDELLIAFIAPPWGDALGSDGLDLRRTSPPVTEIVDVLSAAFASTWLLCAIQVYEAVDRESLNALRSRFDWSALRVYDLNAPGENHGILLGARHWTPGNPAPGNNKKGGPGRPARH
jgi:hypothetical protein